MNKNLKQTKNTRKKPSLSHDSFFKLIFSEPHMIRELLELVLSPAEKRVYNLDDIKLEKDSHKKSLADLVLSFSLKRYPRERVEILAIVEHKSYRDKDLFDQVLKYLILIREHSIRQKGHPLPVIPILFYHGKSTFKWKRTLQEEDFKSLLSKIPVHTRRNMLNYEMKVINTKDPKIRKVFNRRGSKIGGVLKLLDEIWSIKEPSPEKIKSIIADDFREILKGKPKRQADEIVVGVIEYLRDVAKLRWKEWQRAEKSLIEEGVLKKGGIMNIREIIKEKGIWEGVRKGRKEGRTEGRKEGRKEGRTEGRVEGRKEGRTEVISNMLKKNMDISVISQLTDVSEEEIKKIKKA